MGKGERVSKEDGLVMSLKELKKEAKRLAKLHGVPEPLITLTRKKWGRLGHYKPWIKRKGKWDYSRGHIQISKHAKDPFKVLFHEFGHHIHRQKTKGIILEEEAETFANKFMKRLLE